MRARAQSRAATTVAAASGPPPHRGYDNAHSPNLGDRKRARAQQLRSLNVKKSARTRAIAIAAATANAATCAPPLRVARRPRRGMEAMPERMRARIHPPTPLKAPRATNCLAILSSRRARKNLAPPHLLPRPSPAFLRTKRCADARAAAVGRLARPPCRKSRLYDAAALRQAACDAMRPPRRRRSRLSSHRSEERESKR